MVNGLYTASRGMINILARQDLTANNLANANTTGFKISQLATRVEVIHTRNDEKKLHQAENQTLNEVYTRHAQGPLIETGHKLDLALSGPGFFSVETPDGQAFTRNGTFSLNTDKQLITIDGRRVLDDGGLPIAIEGDSVQIQTDGGVFVDGHKQAKLGLKEFADVRKLIANGDGLWSNTDKLNVARPAGDATEIRQGFLEASNVDTVGSMVAMIAYNRNYESDQKVLQAIDSTLGRAVNDVGKV